MAWGRFGDGTATHPIVLRGGSVPGADQRTRWELLGFAVALASVSGRHLTDYVVEQGMVDLLGGADARRLVTQLVAAGYLSETTVAGRPAWRIVQDPDLIHLRLKAEVEWDRTHARVTRAPDYRGPVIARDGSACRRCGRSVSWVDRRGTRAGTIDFLTPGQPDPTVTDLVVLCKGCNSARGKAHADGRLGEWDAAHPLLPAPDVPHYCPDALTYLKKHDIAPRAATVGHDPEERPAHHAGDGDRPGSQPGSGPSRERPTKPSTPADMPPKRAGPVGNGTVKPTGSKGYEPENAGSGRVGSGRAGPGSGGAGRRKRRRR